MGEVSGATVMVYSKQLPRLCIPALGCSLSSLARSWKMTSILLCHKVWSTVSRNEEAIHSGISCGLSQRILGDNKRTPCSLQGFWPSDLAVTGCGIWPPAYQDSMFCWVIVKEVESPPGVSFHEPLPQKRSPKMTPRLLTDTLTHHICTHGHTSTQPILAHSFQPVLAVGSVLPSKSWPG
jgi:hypothetical protein